jgi:hypothetical protein
MDLKEKIAHANRSAKDDILTVSKLDSGLFSITPLIVHPITIIDNLLKMFEAEFASEAITQHLQIHPSFKDLGIDQVLLDSSRLLQILINLVCSLALRKSTLTSTESDFVLSFQLFQTHNSNASKPWIYGEDAPSAPQSSETLFWLKTS